MKHVASRRALYSPSRRNRGAALVVGLVLLMVITLLAISSMSTSTLELQMAGNMQFARKALVASDFAISDALTKANYDFTASVTIPVTTVVAGEPETFNATIAPDTTTAGVTNVPPIAGKGGFSVGTDSSTKACHFVITATGTSARNATATVEQGFFVIGPCPDPG